MEEQNQRNSVADLEGRKEGRDESGTRRRRSLSQGCRPNGFLGLSLNDRIILFLVILLDKTVSVG